VAVFDLRTLKITQRRRTFDDSQNAQRALFWGCVFEQMSCSAQ
jgi:hypothetical protein